MNKEKQIEETIKLMRLAQEQMKESLVTLNRARGLIRRYKLGNTERLKGYIINNLKTLIDKNHSVLGFNVSIEDIIKDIERYSEDDYYDDDEEWDDEDY